MKLLNLGILAHVDAGKTSLTERLLFNNGVIDYMGSVDDGSTQTDSLALERQRGITIKSAVVSFIANDTTINMIDTPGHSDFIAEVERSLSVLDGVVLVVSAVEGVQAQTRVLMRTLQRLRIPTLLFVNKIDRAGADPERIVREIREKLTRNIVPMGAVHEPGTRGAGFAPFGGANQDFVATMTEVLSARNDAILAKYVDGQKHLPYRNLREELAVQTAQTLVHPVYFGSAITGAGVESLAAGITELLPSAKDSVHGPVAGTIFKIERGPAGEKVAFVRLLSGTIAVRDRVAYGPGSERKVTAIKVFERGSTVPRPFLSAGQIGKLWGLDDIQIGDTIGLPGGAMADHQFAPPTLESVVVPRRPSDKGKLHTALAQLAEQDPLINLRQDDVRGELYVSLYGEVQKEVIQATLANDYRLDVDFRETTTICIERPIGVGEAVEIGERGDPYLGTVGLRVEPAGHGTGVQYRRASNVLGTMPDAFFKAVEETVYSTLSQGLYGWQVTDCIVTLTRTGYWPRQSHAHANFDKSMSSTAGDFRAMTPLALMDALKKASTRVYEPMHHFRLEIPGDTLGLVLPALSRQRAVPSTTVMQGASCVLEGAIPAARVYALQQGLPVLTRGEGVLEHAAAHYEPVRGDVPSRPRTDNNPLNRKEYLLRAGRRA